MRSGKRSYSLSLTAAGWSRRRSIGGVGKFLLTVNDHRSNKTRQLTPRLGRESGEHVRDIEMLREVTDQAEGLELQAGKYVLTEVNHPAWSCSIVVE
jgi:hypothetical protein